MNRKEGIFNNFYDTLGVLEEKENEEIPEVTREELEKLRETFRTAAKSTWDVVMSQEMTLVTQTEQVLDLSERSLKNMISNFLNKVRSLFQEGRDIDIRYFKRLSQIGERMESLTYEVETQSMGTKRSKRTTDDESNILSLIAKCHDGHQTLLLQEEAKIQASVKNWAEEFLEAFRNQERIRNRTRILELNHFLDCMKAEEEELDVYPMNQYDDDDI